MSEEHDVAPPHVTEPADVVTPSDVTPTDVTPTDGESADEARETARPQQSGPTPVTLRRAPRYLPFGLTGTGLGVVVGVVLALTFSATSEPLLTTGYSGQSIVGYFAAIFGLFGAIGGLGLAVLIERRHS